MAKKTIQQAYKDPSAYLAAIIESSDDAIISKNLDGTITSWNRAAERIFGYTEAEMLGQPILRIIPPERHHEEEEIISRLRRGERIEHFETMRQAKDGRLIDISITVSPIRDAEGRIVGASKIARDITTHKQLLAIAERQKQELIESRDAAEKANLAKTEFLTNMSHEIRTPMNAVIGLAHILAASEPLTERQREFIRTLQLSADALLALINDLLDIAKIEAGTIELEQIPFRLDQLMDEIATIMSVRAKEKELSFTVKADPVAGLVFRGDATRLRQVVLNLCSNAVKFTQHGGVHVDVKREGGEVRIAVQDTGIGIAPDRLDSIFEKFVQADSSISRKYGGTGLGLAITKTLIERMNGDITVESKAGQGSVFVIRLPLKLSKDAMPESEQQSPAATAPQRHRVLLVEDYAPNVLVATTVLEQFGYDCDVIATGLEAIDRAASGRYALVLMDVQLHGMSGLDATRHIRANERQQGLPPLPIIGMTAHALAGDRERCLGAGMSDYIAKPFNTEDLREKLERFTASKRIAAA